MIHKIQNFVKSKKQIKCTTSENVGAVEDELGIKIPILLRNCLTKIGNGGFGPGYGLVGVGEEGYQSDFGDLRSTYYQIQKDKNLVGESWPKSMLPFCEWGNAMFSCVNCENGQVNLLMNFKLYEQDLTLSDFFSSWIAGQVDSLLKTDALITTKIIRNPFTGGNAEASGHLD
ncbi:MAG: hypothetical protein COA78_06445 [Blastopirellula sp.]|nr:MAG: hypothetical protein COA78_06445 [Blastopirellula sp.]